MKNKPAYGIALHFDGSFIKEDALTARTLGHALTSLQRIVDKAAMFEKRGVLMKGDVLPTVWYPDADLIVKPFEKGCITVPLVGLEKSGVISHLKGVLHDPFEQAISDVPISKRNLVEDLPAAINRALYNIDVTSHSELIKDASGRSKRYFSEAVFRDFDNLISPLRSPSVTDNELISIELRDGDGAKEFEFNKIRSKRFHDIVSTKNLGPVVHYSGRLTEFGETKSRHFPYSGRFFSDATKHEHKLLVAKDYDADLLRKYNTNKHLKLDLLGSPVAAWGAFDEKKGDIVFLTLANR